MLKEIQTGHGHLNLHIRAETQRKDYRFRS